jgi:amphi-Trp domain-containing protein
MAKKKIVLLKSKERREIQGVAQFLRGLADQLEQGQIVLQQGADEVRAEIPSNVVFEIELEEKVKKNRTKRELELEIEWIEGQEAQERVRLG